MAHTLVSLGIQIASARVDPLEGGAIAWLTVDPCAQELLEAAQTQALRFEELGRVPQARVLNDGPQAVVVRADSVVAGGKQTRVVARTSIVPPRSALVVQVRCVEQHRWSPEDPRTASNFTFVGVASRRMRTRLARQRDSSLRTTGRHTLDQRDVWHEVRVELSAARVESLTDSYLPIVTEVRARDRARARAQGVTPASTANAALVMPGRGAAWVEVFPSPAALRPHAEELVADLVEARRVRDDEDPRGPGSVGEAIERLLAAAAIRAEDEEEEERGSLGEPFALQSPRVFGSMLLHESRVAHLSAVIG
jgi:hypothetical protein